MAKQDTVNQIKAKLKEAWVRGKEWRIEVGTLLLELRAEAEHGEWGKLLAELGIPNSTAVDHMTEASRHIYGIRKFDGSAPDPEAVEIEQAVETAAAEVAAVPTPTPASVIVLDEHTKVKGPVLHCTAEQRAAYKAAAKSDKDRVYRIFHAALMEVIGQQEEVCDEAVAA